MICDLAEVYHVYDYRELPVNTLATLVTGLRADSRTKMAINGAKVPTETLILAMIYDKLSQWIWMNTKDGQKRRNEPKSLVELFTSEPKESQVESFDTPEEFDRARQQILNGGG